MNEEIVNDYSSVSEGYFPFPKPYIFPAAQRPRERLIQDGVEVLSDRELLAIILNSGITGKNVHVLAAELLDLLEQNKETPSIKDLCGLGGLGKSKACTILAMLEFGRRRWGPFGVKISTPGDIYTLVHHYADRRQERFISVSLNGAHEVLAVRVITIGLVNKTLIHPREVFSDVIADRSCCICVCHNHPSGKITPSREDDEVTIALVAAAKVLGIKFLDHVIFSETSYYSYRHSCPGLLTPEMIPAEEEEAAGSSPLF
jgi:DNA repair protein RadC